MLKKTDIAILRILEFDSIYEKVLELTVSKVGSECIESLSLFTDNHLLKNELGRVTEMRDLLRFDDTIPLYSFSDIRPFLKRAEVEGAFLRPEEFLALSHFLSVRLFALITR